MDADPRASVAGPLEVRLQNHLVVHCFEDLCTWMGGITIISFSDHLHDDHFQKLGRARRCWQLAAFIVQKMRQAPAAEFRSKPSFCLEMTE
jgi:hypothetical protein